MKRYDLRAGDPCPLFGQPIQTEDEEQLALLDTILEKQNGVSEIQTEEGGQTVFFHEIVLPTARMGACTKVCISACKIVTEQTSA